MVFGRPSQFSKITLIAIEHGADMFFVTRADPVIAAIFVKSLAHHIENEAIDPRFRHLFAITGVRLDLARVHEAIGIKHRGEDITRIAQVKNDIGLRRSPCVGTKKRIGPKQPRFFAMKSSPAKMRSNGSAGLASLGE